MRPLLVGEAPSRGSDPAVPLGGSSGDRLRRLLGDRPLEETFEVRNLLGEWPGPSTKGSAWDARRAREAAEALAAVVEPDRLLVMLGHRVASAFRLDGRYLDVRPGSFPSVVFPHPSAVNRWWNDPRNVERARRFLAACSR